MKHFILPLGVCALLLSGCSDDDAAQVSAPTTFNIETDNPVVKRELPFIRQQCSGLDKYAANFDSFKVYDDSQRPVTTVEFHVKDKNDIPGNYTASGHTCFLFISNNTHEVKISKSACQSVCFDKADVPGGDLVVKLDKEKVPMTADKKPPREGCLMVYSPEPDGDYWTCPRQD
ncbi:hypothetical protein [Escherichia fergusonii]|uniref:hypothetical protein n=1 Tax=Escherichia fergusonii TaxID=564 RepID=UPI002016F19E|nr:hypothetical protein [Escherichia fergusonii]